MPKTIKLFHILGLVLFFGTVPVHILLGQIALSYFENGDTSLAATYRMILVQVIQMLTLPGLALLWLSGLFSVFRSKGRILRQKWILMKLALVFLVSVNGVVILTSLAKELAFHYGMAAATGEIAEEITALTTQEDLFGTLNLLMILAICALACYKPGRIGKTATIKHPEQKVEQITAT
ncbi:DUF2269 family protein [Aestuariispira insulae]|uniref:Putative integral membrane protein DUF2269 n=1 Tax=Aestuariispira insulae TaxID=1461337 RepID=A0A3D9H9G0_9PROT|nr:DUF2269 family protein [Aestuariispira insulae]RED46124.1 putative integral membrane protein DUF2269 [Aestuariispira insulae]